MKNLIKYMCLVLILIICSFFDCLILKNIRMTLAFLIGYTLYTEDNKAVYIFSGAGFLCDLISKTLPCFSFLYLYISLGCVWCEKLFLNMSKRTVFSVSFFWVLVFCFSLQIINMLAFYDVSITFEFFIESVFFAIINGVISLIIYCGFKRVKF